MKKLLLLSGAAILLFGITQKFDGQETTQNHRQLSPGGNTVIERQNKMTQSPFFSRQEPNRWTTDQTLLYQHRMTMPLGHRDFRINTMMAGETHAQHELAAGVDTAWVKHFASEPMPGIDRALDIAIDKSGNVVVTGYITAQENGMDFYTIKYNSSGSQLWVAKYDGNSGDDVPTDMCVDFSGNVYVTGVSGRGFITVKYNASGEEQWITRYSRTDNSYGRYPSIAVDDSNNIYIAGSVEVVNTNMFFLIIKYDSSGKEVWTAQYDDQCGAIDNRVAGLVLDSFGNVYVTGSNSKSSMGTDYATIKYNSTGILQWVARFNGAGNNSDWPAALAVDTLGNVYVTGWSTRSAGDGSYYATVKYDASGIQKWVAVYGSASEAGWSYASALAVDHSGNVYVTGTSSTIKYNTDGVEQWVARGTGNDIAVGNAGYVYVTGVSGGDFVTVKYSASGTEQWLARYNGTDSTDDIPTAMAVDDSGNVYVTGAGDIHYLQAIALELYCDYATVKYNTSGVEQWVARYNGPGEIHASASDMAMDEAGNVYVTGYCRGEFWGLGWFLDYITIKYDATGTVQWIDRCHEGSEAAKIAVDGSGNVYVTGFGDESGYITVKYNASGIKQWVAHCDKDVVAGSKWPGFPWQISLTVDDSGNVYVAGGVDVSNANSDYITIKYNSSGNEQWVVTYDGPCHFFDEANAIAVDDSGNVYVTGTSQGNGADIVTIKYDRLGIEQWVARFDGPGTGPSSNWDMASDMLVDKNGNVYVTGRTRSATTGEDFVTIKYNGSGISQWIVRYSGPGYNWDEATALTLDNAGNVYVTGLSNGGDYATIKYNNSGEQQWVARYSSSGGRSYDFPYDLAVDASGNVFVTGFSIGLRDDTDFTTIKYNASGVEQWITQYNGPGDTSDEAWCIAVDDAGQIYVTGTNWGSNWNMMTTIKYTETGTLLVIKHEPASVPVDFNLKQNYPNPFNPATTIEFTLPKSTFVTLKVYNLLGKEVAMLVAEKRSAGIHKFNWDARGLASGVYLYRLEAGEFVEVKKLILMR